jgi:1-acyl-sn-glycerol-3-phosphate acyltransferase
MRGLRNGQILGIFPEGKIESTRELLPFQTGVAMMAMKTGVPVFPAYLDGTQRGRKMLAAFLLPQRATVAFGDEVVFDRRSDDRDALVAATAAMQRAIESLRELAATAASNARPRRGL